MVSHFHAYVYDVIVHTDHSAVKAVLETTNQSAKHACWWTIRVSNIHTFYHPGKENMNADALSQNHLTKHLLFFNLMKCKWQTDYSLLTRDPLSINGTSAAPANEFVLSQQQDPELWEIIEFLTYNLLPEDKTARKVVALAHSFALLDGVFYFIDVKHNHQK